MDQSSSPSREKGCILGALLGDALGAYLELNKLITAKEVT
jgi:ADP-ribosylglycohydrolase